MNAIRAVAVLTELKNLIVSWRLKRPFAFHSITAALLAIFLLFRFSVTIPILILFIGGFALGLFFLSPDFLFPNLLWIYNRSKKTNKDKRQIIKSCHVCGKKECERHRSELNIQSLQPWIDIEIPEKINEALEDFFNIFLKEHVHSWYSDLSSDDAVINELKQNIRFAASNIYKRISKVDIPNFISNKIIPLSLKHLHRCLKVIKSQEKSTSPQATVPSDFKMSSPDEISNSVANVFMMASNMIQQSAFCENQESQNIEQLILDSYGHELHFAARTRRSELEYLKEITDKTSPLVFPPANLKSRIFSVIIKELFTGAVLLPAMDVIADPDIINDLLILFLDKSPLEENKDAGSLKVPILQGFSQRSSFQNQKNLQLKLSAVLSDPELLFPFMQFMKAEASVNVLQFYLVIEEFNRKVLTPELTPENLDELHRDLQKYYENYFDPGAHDCIRFDPDITSQIKEICDGPPEGIIKLQTTTPLFRAYEQAYDLLEYNFLPLFHQSDIYYTMLCGERIPSKLYRSNSKAIKRVSTVESLVRLSSKIKCVFKSNAVDGRPICGDDEDEVEQVGDPLMNEEFFLQASNENNARQPESPVNLSDDSSYLLIAGNGGSEEENPLRDLSLWVVSIPSIITKVDPADPNNPKKYFYIFKVEIKRLAEDRESNDPFEPEEWSIERRYHEFYVLETKLKEFHGEFEDAQLPPKKTFVPKNKNFFETLRPNFELFLRILLTKPNLKGSQLVHSFLTSDQEFTTSFLDVNLGKKVKSGAMKLVKERGQHLEPFLKSFLQSVEYQKTKPVKSSSDRDSDTLSISSEKMINSIYNNNANIEDLPISDVDAVEEEGSYFDALLYISHFVFRAPDWVIQILLSFRIVFRNTIDAFLDSFVAKKLEHALSEHYIVKVINDLIDVVFFNNDLPRTDEDKRIRRMNALQELKDFIPKLFARALGTRNCDEGIELIFNLLQQPRLNKQLCYVILDSVLIELFPELKVEALNQIGTTQPRKFSTSFMMEDF